ncbi:hypothetical protein TWF225_001865 [Orbilia oligospora]|uniref:Uncharacterized protein n=1 Tax=Orbilia oligospora TaxID=2813651 RepID=A0A8H2HSJ4_ORBOL|nr:hypothetical protein TWF225_001865 [Orbilia oligospora]KAF3262256.1 hypothetical protein TWF217_004321 [Orbilia oligospora]KAF3265246.1 hypothetical protein TWF128_000534 [Orbilia oligospora]TGJ70561.1 hypothetical protein EYR41_002595 [Orbilia oligospora]
MNTPSGMLNSCSRSRSISGSALPYVLKWDNVKMRNYKLPTPPTIGPRNLVSYLRSSMLASIDPIGNYKREHVCGNGSRPIL